MSDHTTGQLVVFSLGEEEYALPISYVHEIIRYTAPRTVASSDRSVCGVISLRGKIIPVFDLATRLHLDRQRAEQAKIVIVETDRDGAKSLAGLVVDDVEEVITVSDEQIDSDGGSGVTGICVEGIAKIDDRLVVLLSPNHIVAIDVTGGARPAEFVEGTGASGAPVPVVAESDVVDVSTDAPVADEPVADESVAIPA